MATVGSRPQNGLQGDLVQGSSLAQSAESNIAKTKTTSTSTKRPGKQAAGGKKKSSNSVTKQKQQQPAQSPMPGSRPRTGSLDAKGLLNATRVKTAGPEADPQPTTAAPKKGSVKGKKDTSSASAAVRARLAAMNASPDPFAMNRSGRQFTVGHVGTGGAIYLRPMTRPGSDLIKKNQLGGIDVPPPVPEKDKPSKPKKRISSFGGISVLSSAYTTTRDLIPRSRRSSFDMPRQSTPSRRQHTRVHSFSSIDDRLSRKSSFSGNGSNTYKVVIRRPRASSRRRVTHGSARGDGSIPQVPQMPSELPSPKSPRFGTHLEPSDAQPRASLQDPRQDDSEPLGSSPERGQTGALDSKHQSDATAPRTSTGASLAAGSGFFEGQNSSDILIPRPKALDNTLSRTSNTALAMHIFNDLSTRFNDPSVVRFAPNSQEIVAATPSRLIAHITSPSFLDYELLSDFFLTFRLFMQTDDLATFLVARLRWSVERQDDAGRIVRVRTFVALRHWILNYFADDFAPDFALRCHFCDLVNDLFHDLQQRTDGGGGDIKVIGELKKCWSRTCSLYWPKAGKLAHVDDDIFPGGRYDSINFENEDIDPDYLQAEPDAAKALAAKKRHSRRSGLSQTGAGRSALSPILQTSPAFSSAARDGVPLSPTSIQSVHVVSCSIPIRSNKSDISTSTPMQPHPHPVPLAPLNSSAINTPTALKSSYFMQHSNRSFDSAWEDPNYVEEPFQPGSLVRGALYQPTNPYFEWRSPDRLPPTSSHGTDGTGILVGKGAQDSEEKGMRRLFGNVRRVLGGKPTTTLNRQSGTAIDEKAPLAQKEGPLSKLENGQTTLELRMDLLASWAADQFKDAVEEELGANNAKSDKGKKRAYDPLGAQEDSRLLNQRSLTIGSRSIVIMDDTNDFPETPRTPGAHLDYVGADLEQEDFDDHDDVDGISAITPFSGNVSPRRSGETDISALEAEFQQRHGTKGPVAQAGAYLPTGFKGAGPATRQPTHGTSTDAAAAAAASAARLKKYASFNSGFMNSTHTSYVKPADTSSEIFDPPSPLPLNGEDGDSEPSRTLRRRPGGDLKGATNVEDLSKRRHSVRSMTTPADSVPVSFVQSRSRAGTGGRPPQSMHTIRTTREAGSPDDKRSQKSASASAATPRRRRRGKSISLMETHSSQPNLRPSFEAEVAKLKALPDDEMDDGGIQATLLKLEGRYERKSPTPPIEQMLDDPDLPTKKLSKHDVKQKRHHEHVENVHPERALPPTSVLQKSVKNKSTSKPAKPYSKRKADGKGKDSKPSADQVLKHDQRTGAPSGQSAPAPERVKPRRELITSFLLDDQQELQDDQLLSNNGISSFYDDDHESSKSTENLGPRTIDGTLFKVMDGPIQPSIPKREASQHITTFNKGLPTPEGSPTLEPTAVTHIEKPSLEADKRKERQALGTRERRDTPPEIDEEDDVSEHNSLLTPRHSNVHANHLPFIMAYSPEFLAKQFTIVETDALDELDWRELVEIRWNQTPPAVRDWVSYLRSTEGSTAGVGLIIARFNLMVKWVLSELLLTTNHTERARVMVQYIQIACAARKLRNFATMYQIAVALLSADAARMRRAWMLVPQPERENLRDLERVVQPLRNFHNLRLEMETAPTEAGCIPFIGIYTRDLVYNAQKPALFSPRKHPYGRSMPSRPGYDNGFDDVGENDLEVLDEQERELPMMVMGEGEPMVNFERQHNAASIVKTLLRLLEQSANYKFVADASVVSRCLWVASLSDEEIKERVSRVE